MGFRCFTVANNGYRKRLKGAVDKVFYERQKFGIEDFFCVFRRLRGVSQKQVGWVYAECFGDIDNALK